ncbi:hypothetical protein GCM10010112_69670 [Actinoplanes lobatus]|uniref:DUF4062 domain-containing protein n=1 Tax=Actinoplanes lobatus TaxID=113568 RepID=A0A7W7HM89_9ACTN|nr:hypothetical protein [Actinoplanes lobatus]MBB4753056.1 hypothetical protein [Actinoplanes lobatus]GGN87233.1 hypothetical protein GCM10010112_69670 [Actinoplanes lobatus]GIE39663.1 hypothetical protein Alo02nite_25610 [Actinoplanes lobatus]
MVDQGQNRIQGYQLGDRNVQINLYGDDRMRRVLIGYTPELATSPESRSFAKAAEEAVISAECAVVKMPGWTDPPTVRQFRGNVKEFDIYVCLLGFCFGTPMKDAWWKSLPRAGLDWARKLGKPYIAIVIDKGPYTAEHDFYIDPEYQGRQRRFRRAVRSGRYHYCTVDSPDQLAEVLTEFLGRSAGRTRAPRPPVVDASAVALSVVLGVAGFLAFSVGVDMSVNWAATTAVLAAAGTYRGSRGVRLIREPD